ncbi:trypsin-like serine protease [Kitasatospora griseola]|uniref:trypsin-like serine protease n=1 Tax=Kitasatospora griseola TaxID=2064 RepID=UPI0037F8E169
MRAIKRFLGIGAVGALLLAAQAVPADATGLGLAPGTARAAGATSTDPAAFTFTAKLSIADKRACTGALVDPLWVIAASSCFTDAGTAPTALTAGAPKDATTVLVGHTDAATAGQTRTVVDLVPRADRDLVLARLNTPILDIAPLALSSTAPATAEQLQVTGFGRTRTNWVPALPHLATFGVDAPTTGEFTLNAPTPTDATVCKGDAGGPAWRTENGKPALVGIVSRSWQGGCLGTPATETRTSAQATRVDGLGSWLVAARATEPGWKASVLVNGDNGALYRAVRLPDGTLTDFSDIQGRTGVSGGVKAFAQAGINSETEIVALGNDGHLWHSSLGPESHLPGTPIMEGPRTDLTGSGRPLADITSVSAVSIGWNLHVVAVAGGKVYHTMRDGNGAWSSWGDVLAVTGQIGTVSTAAIANVGNEMHVVAVADGKAYHTIRLATGSWGGWGDVAQAAGATGPISGVTIAGAGSDAHIAVLVDNGARQFHTIRYANRTWQPFADLSGVWGSLTATSVGASLVDNQIQFTVTTGDNRLLWTARNADQTWAPVTALNPQAGTHNQNAITAYVL